MQFCGHILCKKAAAQKYKDFCDSAFVYHKTRISHEPVRPDDVLYGLYVFKRPGVAQAVLHVA